MKFNIFCLSNILWVFGIATGAAGQIQSSAWVPLFNGKNLAGWDTYMRQPEGTNEKPFALNNDPLKVYTVSEGAIHVSGQIWGGVSTKDDYENYHLRFKVKWGEKKWYPSPNDSIKRDAGLLYHATGPFNFAYGCWLRSSELQIQEGEIGDFFGVGAGSAEFPMSKIKVKGKILDQYNAAAPLRRNADAIGGGRVYRSGNFERKHGDWNTAELITRGADAVYIVNGYVVNRLFNTYRDSLQLQTTRGKIQFQSEGAEVFYKEIELRPVNFIRKSAPSVTADLMVIKNINSETPQNLKITNSGDDFELVAVELIGASNDQFRFELPAFPLLLEKGKSLTLPIFVKSGTVSHSTAKLRLETILGPVANFEVNLESK
ncbi:protein of unknown function [Dyadobacter koreensis]|uniref:3-keto-alpha-glucoside-1,2-lyase/3-keto-2-hydroxy-glucal hydratase domain-containing protein n=1 Tax=Dyadobacter koreensis TaxID=408657 RepID=A0A1H7ASL9_9BACT|nr:DUF1080 domain-containing protein [Dyadobacter koreensis]SEJ64025.1 protein of unknown function [Dyadobacter koreensis]